MDKTVLPNTANSQSSATSEVEKSGMKRKAPAMEDSNTQPSKRLKPPSGSPKAEVPAQTRTSNQPTQSEKVGESKETKDVTMSTQQPQKEEPILLSPWDRSLRIKVLPDKLTAIGDKGYRMARCTHGVSEGEWYFEIRVNQPFDIKAHWEKVGAGDLTKDKAYQQLQAHTRLGFSAGKADLNAPCGFDRYSFAYRDIQGTKFHQSRGRPYGSSYGPGDVIGCHIYLPPSGERAALSALSVSLQQAEQSGSSLAEMQLPQLDPNNVSLAMAYVPTGMPLPGSRITFYKNGISQGVAFSDIPRDTYYPAASLYMGASVTFNFGPNYWHAPAELMNKTTSLPWSVQPKLKKRPPQHAKSGTGPK